MDMMDEKPAKLSPRKNRIASGFPITILANSWGIQMNVSPVLAGPLVLMISSVSV